LVDQHLPWAYQDLTATALIGLNWFFDPAETISDRSSDRIAALGGGITVQHRMTYRANISSSNMVMQPQKQRHRLARYSRKACFMGTDATRVASYNPWVSLSWMITGKTVAGMQLYPRRNCLDRETAH